MRINTTQEEVQWLDHRITEEIFHAEDETSIPRVIFFFGLGKHNLLQDNLETLFIRYLIV